MSTETRQLSEREIEILRLVAAGLSNQQIANELGVTINTVKVHLRNVFGKIGAASRTEATLYAVRMGLVTVDRVEPGPVEEMSPDQPGALPAVEDDAPEVQAESASADPPVQIEVERDAVPATSETSLVVLEPRQPAKPVVGDMPLRSTVHIPVPRLIAQRDARRRRWALGGLALLILIAGVAITRVWVWPAVASRGEQPAYVIRGELARWKELSAAPTARAAFAVANLGGLMYVIGGENQDGILDSVERFDTHFATWTALSAKPTAVTDVHAAVLGGQIYVPGGRRSANPADISDAFERYDPRTETWEALPPLPQPRSAYALAVLEGKLYLFGGWDGAEYRAEVFQYDPDTQTWQERMPAPTARAYAGAGVVEGSIYIIGGENASGPLASNEQYVPAEDRSGGQPWSRRAPLREPRSRFGTAVVLSSIHVVGGASTTQPLAKYDVLTDSWQVLGTPPKAIGSQPGVVLVETTFVTLGGKQGANQYSTDLQTYQALYNVFVPGPGP